MGIPEPYPVGDSLMKFTLEETERHESIYIEQMPRGIEDKSESSGSSGLQCCAVSRDLVGIDELPEGLCELDCL